MLLAHNYPSLTHSLDIWHKAKRLRKALAEVRLEMDFILITLPTSFCFKAGKAKGDTDVLKVCGIFLKAVSYFIIVLVVLGNLGCLIAPHHG